MAQHGFAINPNPNLKEIAIAEGWTIYQPQAQSRNLSGRHLNAALKALRHTKAKGGRRGSLPRTGNRVVGRPRIQTLPEWQQSYGPSRI